MSEIKKLSNDLLKRVQMILEDMYREQQLYNIENEIDIKVKKLKKSFKITIIDNGKGMSNDVLNHIGEVFYSTKHSGTGIGIAYIKKIIELHKGKIVYKSKEKEGTTIIINLPSLD